MAKFINKITVAITAAVFLCHKSCLYLLQTYLMRNPFADEEIKTKTRYIAETLGDKAIIDTETGEIENISILSAQKRLDVDTDLFVKLYKPCIDAMKDMPMSSFAIFRYILNYVKYSDTIVLNVNKISKFTGYRNKSSIYSGIRWLVDNQFIAKKRGETYWINFHFFYKGNRLKIK